MGDCAGQTCGEPHTQHRRFSRLDNAWRAEFGDEAERPRRAELLRSGVAIFDLDYDAILAAMYALSVSAEGDCYMCVPPDPGIEAAALGASESVLPGTTPAQALHTFTLDSGASRCFFRDSTTLTPLSAPVPVKLTDPSEGPFLAHSSTVLPCPAVLFSSLTGHNLPLFSTNLASTTALQDAMVTTTTLGGQCVSVSTCTRTGRHLATFTRWPGSSPYTLATEPPQTLLWHHRFGHPSLPQLRGMHSRLLVSGLPRSLPPLSPSPAPSCLPCIEGWQRAAPYSSSFPPTNAPLQTLHMDVWGPARVSGQGRERYFLLVGDDYTRYTTVFPLRSKGGEFSPDLLRDFCRGEGILQSFTLSDSTQQNGIAERRIGLVMEVARTSMIHEAAPHFLWPFAGRYAAHQLNLWPHVSLTGILPTLRWTGKVGNASVFRVWGSRAFVRDMSADKLSARAIPCDVTFNELVPFYRLFPYHSAPPPSPLLLLAPGPPPVDPLPPQGPAPSGVSQVDPLLGTAPVEVAGARSGGAEPGGAEPGGAQPAGVEPEGAEPEGVELGGAESEGTESGGAEKRGTSSFGGPAGVSPRLSPWPEPLSPQHLREWFAQRTRHRSGAVGAGGTAAGDTGARGVGITRLGGAGGTSGAGGTLQVLLHVAAQRDYELHSLDFTMAFLQGSLHEEIFLHRPPGFTGTTLAPLGFAPSTADPSLFLRTDTSLPPFYVLVYIDDLVFATADTEALTLVKSELQKSHTCTELGELRSYLGLQITRDRARCTITVTQSHMVHQVLQRFGFQFSLPQPTPLSTGQSLLAPPSDESVEPSGPYPELVGCLILGTGSVSWRSTRSSSVLSSSCEAEIYAGAMAAQELRWLTCLLTNLGEQPRLPPVLYVDNQAMIALCQEHRLEHRTKHIALRYFLARELQQRGQLRLAYVATRANNADKFTKALPPCDHQRFSTILGILALLFLTEAAYLGANESALPGTAPAKALHTFTLDPGASRCFFRDSTTLTPLFAPVPVRLADSLGGPVLARTSTVLLCTTVPSSPLSGLHLPSFSTNLVSTAALQGAMVTTTTPGGFHVRSGSTPLLVSPPVAPDPPVTPPPWSPLPASLFLVFPGLCFPSRPRLPCPGFLALRGGSAPRLTPPRFPRRLLPCRHFTWTCGAQRRERYFLLVVDDYTLRLQLSERFREDLPVLRLHSDIGGEFSSDLLRDFCRGEGILQSFMLPASPQENGIAERRVGLVMEVARTSMIHVAAPHFLWPFAVRYAAHQLNLVLGGRSPVVFTGHADASWVDDSVTQRSSQGYTSSLGSGFVSWRSTRSSSVLSSSCEAEIYAGAMAPHELRWLTYLLTDLGEQPLSPPVLYVHNKAMIALCQEHRLEHRTKHIAMQYFLAQELQQRGQLRLAYVATRANSADIFTKALPPGDHQCFSTVLGLVPTLPHLLTS
ncbi:unnamed protein product [Closterium sp. NIES-53]